MENRKHYTTTVPSDYVLVKYVDAKKDKKLIVAYSVLSFVPVVILLPLLCLASGLSVMDVLDNRNTFPALFIACIIMQVYIVLHELVHGVTYKAFTGAKLTFGFSLTVAFCGVPNIYVRKKASLLSLFMPFLVFSLLFLGLTVVLWPLFPLYGILAGTVFAVHLGGCVGDLHWALLYLTRFRHCETLMRDSGPAQWLYIPGADAERHGISPIVLPVGER